PVELVMTSRARIGLTLARQLAKVAARKGCCRLARCCRGHRGALHGRGLRAGSAYADLDARNMAVDGEMRAQPLGVMSVDPALEEARRHAQLCDAGVDAAELERAEPARDHVPA